jgi:hypothetical protein
LPSGLGGEAAGVVEEVGSGVTDLKPGDRVAYGSAPIGAYAEARLIPADRLLKLPDGIDDKTAAAMMLKGLTVQYLIRQTYRVKSGDTILLPRRGRRRRPDPQSMGKASRRHRDRTSERDKAARQAMAGHTSIREISSTRVHLAIVAKSSRYVFYQPEVCNWTNALRSKRVASPHGAVWLEDLIVENYAPASPREPRTHGNACRSTTATIETDSYVIHVMANSLRGSIVPT